MMEDIFDLQRFAMAQEAVFETVRSELRAGHKRTHWMWFVFPQLAGLGTSAMAQHYAIAGRAEAAAYLAHPVLGPRLRECTGLVNAVEGRTAREILGPVDEAKFRSSMTLFATIAGDENVFSVALENYFAGQKDIRTLEILGAA
jgi:uncharacterized protein (DUF1810 family)